jgi:hypothetical protein
MRDQQGNDHGGDGRFERKPKGESNIPLTEPAQPVTRMVRYPGEPPYEEVSSVDGKALGYCMYREGVYIASIHNGRAPRNVGEFDSRDEALAALVENNSEGQSDRFL